MQTKASPIESLVPFILALVLSASGCAGAAAARDMSATTAHLTDTYKTETQNFFAAQDDMVQALAQEIASHQELAAVLENQTRVQRGSWQASNDVAAVRVYDSLSTQSESAILSSNIDLLSLRPIATPASTTIDPKPFESVTATLNQMAQEPSLTDRAKFLFNYAKDVSSQYKKSLADGTKTAANATNKTKNQAPPKSPPR